MTAALNTFPQLCRQWRQSRHLSQLALAENAEVSQRHLSWLETGRSQPSRDMVLKLAEALEIPLRERNSLLLAAGYAPYYRESSLEEPHMVHVRAALRRVLEHQEPFPAIVVDRAWNQVLGNKASELLLALSDRDADDPGPFNLAEATLRPGGLRRFILNPEVALPLFVLRLRREALASGEASVIARVEALIRAAGPLPELDSGTDSLLPVLPIELELDGLHLSLFSVMSTFGTPQDVTTDELRIESFYPMDNETTAFFETIASGSAA
ncbi:MAG: helix-turn-helix transcriptional regulator [Pseudomonadota bacterium]